jgi:hypothetical protein
MVFATVPNPGHLLSELECNALFCINSTAGTVTIGGTASIPLIVNGRITSTGTPTASTDVATKGYVDGLVGSGGGLMNTVEFTSSTQWTVPTNVEIINVTLVGGGGAGGMRNASTTFAGGGGGSGNVTSYQLTVTPEEVLTVIVGSGGIGTSTESCGKCGGASYLVKDSGKIFVWADGGSPGSNGMDYNYGGPGGLGRCSGGCGYPRTPAPSGYCSSYGQCGGGTSGKPGNGGTGYGSGGGGGGSEYTAGGGGGGYYGTGSETIFASNGTSTYGGDGAPGIVFIAY